MKNKKNSFRIIAGLIALALLIGGQSFSAFADEKSFKEQALEAAASIPDELPKAKIKVTVEPNDTKEGFVQPGVVYTTYNPSDEPLEHIEEFVTINGVSYKAVAAGAPKQLAEQDMTPAGVDYVSEPFTDKTKGEDPDEVIEYQGVELYLDEKELVEIDTEAKSEYHSETVRYRDVESGLDAPDRQSIEFTDTATGQRVTATLKLKSAEEVDRYWSDEFTFPIALTNYNADEFDLNGTIVKKNEPLIDYASNFLEMLNLDPNYYEITKIEWAGEPYTNANGVLCRNAAAFGRKLLRTIEATYAGDVKMPSTPAYQWECKYKVAVDPSKAVMYTMVTEVTLVNAAVLGETPETAASSEEAGKKSLWDIIKGIIMAIYKAVKDFVVEHPAESVSIFVVLAAFIVFLFMQRAKHRCIYNKKLKCIHKKHDENTCMNCPNYYKQSNQ